MNPREDLEIAWIRDVRMRISEEFGHDPERLINHYIELQKRHQDRLIYAPGATIAETAAESLVGEKES
jgi:hypothetical protein